MKVFEEMFVVYQKMEIVYYDTSSNFIEWVYETTKLLLRTLVVQQCVNHNLLWNVVVEQDNESVTEENSSEEGNLYVIDCTIV